MTEAGVILMIETQFESLDQAGKSRVLTWAIERYMNPAAEMSSSAAPETPGASQILQHALGVSAESADEMLRKTAATDDDNGVFTDRHGSDSLRWKIATNAISPADALAEISAPPVPIENQYEAPPPGSTARSMDGVFTGTDGIFRPSMVAEFPAGEWSEEGRRHFPPPDLDAENGAIIENFEQRAEEMGRKAEQQLWNEFSRWYSGDVATSDRMYLSRQVKALDVCQLAWMQIQTHKFENDNRWVLKIALTAVQNIDPEVQYHAEKIGVDAYMLKQLEGFLERSAAESVFMYDGHNPRGVIAAVPLDYLPGDLGPVYRD